MGMGINIMNLNGSGLGLGLVFMGFGWVGLGVWAPMIVSGLMHRRSDRINAKCKRKTEKEGN